MTHMMNNPVAAMMVLVGLVVVLAAVLIAVRLYGGRQRTAVPGQPVGSQSKPPQLEE